jgi:hypothetical protein
MVCEAYENPPRIILGIEVVELRRLGQRVERGGALST